MEDAGKPKRRWLDMMQVRKAGKDAYLSERAFSEVIPVLLQQLRYGPPYSLAGRKIDLCFGISKQRRETLLVDEASLQLVVSLMRALQRNKDLGLLLLCKATSSPLAGLTEYHDRRDFAYALGLSEGDRKLRRIWREVEQGDWDDTRCRMQDGMTLTIVVDPRWLPDVTTPSILVDPRRGRAGGFLLSETCLPWIKQRLEAFASTEVKPWVDHASVVGMGLPGRSVEMAFALLDQGRRTGDRTSVAGHSFRVRQGLDGEVLVHRESFTRFRALILEVDAALNMGRDPLRAIARRMAEEHATTSTTDTDHPGMGLDEDAQTIRLH